MSQVDITTQFSLWEATGDSCAAEFRAKSLQQFCLTVTENWDHSGTKKKRLFGSSCSSPFKNFYGFFQVLFQWANNGQIPHPLIIQEGSRSQRKVSMAKVNQRISPQAGIYPALGMKTQNAGRSTGSFADDNSLVPRGYPEKEPLPAPYRSLHEE